MHIINIIVIYVQSFKSYAWKLSWELITYRRTSMGWTLMTRLPISNSFLSPGQKIL